MKHFNRLIAPYLRMIRMTVSRGVIKKINDDPKMQEMQVKMLKDEVYSDLERFNEYGFTSVPLDGSEAIVVCIGGDRDHSVIIKTDDRRYRLKGLKGGEVALYTDEGDKIHLKRNKEIEIICGNKLTATVENDVEITTKRAKLTASEKCEIISPDIKLTSDTTVEISGDSKVTINSETKVEVNCDDVAINGSKVELGGSDGTMRKLIDERLIELFNAHTHGGLVPTSPLTLEAVATTITKAG
jgi:phage baseplate assembly protein V